MQRTTGTGFIGFGLVLIVVGAILKFAVTADANGFDIEAAGLIADLGRRRVAAARHPARGDGRPTSQHRARQRRADLDRYRTRPGARRLQLRRLTNSIAHTMPSGDHRRRASWYLRRLPAAPPGRVHRRRRPGRLPPPRSRRHVRDCGWRGSARAHEDRTSTSAGALLPTTRARAVRGPRRPGHDEGDRLRHTAASRAHPTPGLRPTAGCAVRPRARVGSTGAGSRRPAGLHHLGQLVERRRVPVGGAEHPDTAGVAFGLHPAEMFAPGHQVVDLQQIDAATVEVQLRRELRASLFDRGRPDLGGDESRPRDGRPARGPALPRRARTSVRSPRPGCRRPGPPGPRDGRRPPRWVSTSKVDQVPNPTAGTSRPVVPNARPSREISSPRVRPAFPGPRCWSW